VAVPLAGSPRPPNPPIHPPARPLTENCIDRHLATRGDEAALIWEKDEPNQAETITYNMLHENVCKFANVLKDHGELPSCLSG
jgi:acyl-coenzyme A synthetase/AMP-(fatty) acid ligase